MASRSIEKRKKAKRFIAEFNLIVCVMGIILRIINKYNNITSVCTKL
jgi:hypothetical protein